MIAKGQDPIVEHDIGVVNDAMPGGRQVSKASLVHQLLQDLGTAALRPLYSEVALPSSWRSCAVDPPGASIKNTSCENVLQRTWIELLDDAVPLLPYCSDDEHGEILRIMSVFLLSFLLPYATGMDYYLLQNMRDGGPSVDPSKEGRPSLDEYIINVSLEERLAKTVVHSLSSNHYGSDEATTLTDVDVDLALGELLDRISRILQQRPVHSYQVDIIHLLAMIIHPYHKPESIGKAFDTSLDRSCPSCATAVRFMENPIGIQFHVHHGHRRQIVQLVQRFLLLPKIDSGRSPLYAGAIPHLCASLRQFSCHMSEDPKDSHDALAAIVSLVIQLHCSKENIDSVHSIVKSEWDWLLHRTMDDRLVHPCRCLCREPNHLGIVNLDVDNNKNGFCTYYARGMLLSIFIERRCKHKSDVVFLTHAAQALAEAIEWQVDCWTIDSVDTSEPPSFDIDVKNKNYPCLLASLLLAATSIIVLWTSSGVPEQESIEDNPFATILHCALQLLAHSDTGVVSSAAGVLSQAFTYENEEKMEQYVAPLAMVITEDNFEQRTHGTHVVSVLAVVASKSSSFALSLLYFILKRFEVAFATNMSETSVRFGEDSIDILTTWMVAIAINRPMVCIKKMDSILDLFQESTFLPSHRCRLAHALLCSRQTHYFTDDMDGRIGDALRKFVHSESTNFWICYHIGRIAMVSGNANVAQVAFRKVLARCESIEPLQYLWISVLERIATADTFLTCSLHSNLKEAVLDIPNASKALHSSSSYMESLRSISKSWKDGGGFQLRFLLLRLDFLDLIIVLRQLTRERRLTGRGPMNGTRSRLHLRNVVKCFKVLALRFRELYIQYGLFFVHSQSGTSLFVLQFLSSFMAHATKACFSDVFSSKVNQKRTSFEKSSFCTDDEKAACHPLALLIKRLDELVVQPMIQSDVIDPLLRAAATLELIDGILLVPFPMPRDFFKTFPSHVPEFLISAAPNPVFAEFDESLSIIETSPLMCFTFCCSGCIPVQFFQDVRAPTWTIVLWFQINYSGPLLFDDEETNNPNNTDNNFLEGEPSISPKEVRIPDLSALSPVKSALSVDGFFFFSVECPPLTEEGLYILRTKLGCCDIHGNLWEFPSCRPDSLVATIRVSSSRSLL